MKIPSPLPYDARWVTHLLRRDIKNLTAKYASKIKSKFANKVVKTDAPLYQQIDIDLATVEPECLQRTPEPSIVEEKGPDRYLQPTMYEILEALHKQTYAPVDRDRLPEERFKYRGGWLLLQRAIQACPSNPSYNIFREEGEMPDDSQLLIEVIKLSVLKHSSLPSATRVSQMPTEPYTKRSSDHMRVDSTTSTISFAPKPVEIPSAGELWHIILEGVVNKTKTIEVGEYLLGHVWPGKDAAGTLHQIGAIGSQMSESEDDDLRERLRVLLLPESKTFGIARPIACDPTDMSMHQNSLSVTADTASRHVSDELVI